jgi:hypothetical protein
MEGINLMSVQNFRPQIARNSNYRMCDRDIKLVTSEYDNSFEDLKVELSQTFGAHTYKELDWGEISLEGVYTCNPHTMEYEACSNQSEAETSGMLSVWDYQAKSQDTSGTPIEWDIAGGSFVVDDYLSGNRWDHRFYVIAAPEVPNSLGGQIRFFDSYMALNEGKIIKSDNLEAKSLDPSANQLASKVKVLTYYPKGAKQTHIFRLRTYRPPNTW